MPKMGIIDDYCDITDGGKLAASDPSDTCTLTKNGFIFLKEVKITFFFVLPHDNICPYLSQNGMDRE